MVKVYILNNNRGKYYVGITSLDLNKRLERHNNGKVYSTKHFRPWRIIYTEEYSNFNEARQREKQIKSWHGGNAFKKLVSSVAGSSNGRTTDSESVNLGPTPSPATLLMASRLQRDKLNHFIHVRRVPPKAEIVAGQHFLTNVAEYATVTLTS